ncbi:MAG: hypothetical protein EHM21_08215 [Chloroflexi bacterium]|nr:MAG: hypothetical protein EHM21_08215 [Chloroflexota bacterium]
MDEVKSGAGPPAEGAAATAEVRSSKTLWFGMFASPVIWSIYLVVGYALAEAACMTGLLTFEWFGVSALLVVLLALSVLTVGGILWNAWWSHRSWRHYAAQNPEEEHPLQAYDRDEFLALSGLLLSGIFLFLVLINVYPLLTLRLCV